MVANLIAAFRKRIDALTWMDPATKAEAQAKLTTLYVGVGYPETWKDYSDLRSEARRYFRKHLARPHVRLSNGSGALGKPVNRQEWTMTPQTVNAVNLPLQNALNFPAAILQPPFFDAKAPDAANYGAMGSVIGHEISHTFDTEGSAFDSKGRVRNWWTDADLKHFEEATARLAAQYDTYKPFPIFLERKADARGKHCRCRRYFPPHTTATMPRSPAKPGPEQDGFSGDQQFFIAFAQNWGVEIAGSRIAPASGTPTPHSPAQYRADTVRNIDAWYRCLRCAAGRNPIWPRLDRVHWVIF